VEPGEILADGMGPLCEAELYYYLPCGVRDHMIACTAIDRPMPVGLLTSEDLDLLITLSGYVAIAIHNCLLHQNLAREVEQMSRLKLLLENAIDSVAVGILVLGADGRILIWNKAIEKVFVVTRQQAVGRHLDEVLECELTEVLKSAIKQGYQTRASYKVASHQLALHISVAPLETVHGAMGTLVMIEAAQSVEQPVQQERKPSELESKALLAAISRYAWMLLEEIPEGDRWREMIGRTRGDLEHTKFCEVDINHLLDESLCLLDQQLRGAGVEVVRRYAQGLPMVYGSSFELQQVFIMLMLNACDLMAEGGQLSIQTRLVGTSLVIDLRDSGAGLFLEDIARIHDPFLSGGGYGADLGLLLCYRIIRRHGGRIFAESRPGEGTHFAIKLPAASVEQTKEGSAERQQGFFRRYSPRSNPDRVKIAKA
jgi:two-component system NtrC family sensor kinase